jgi:hypothetical protein
MCKTLTIKIFIARVQTPESQRISAQVNRQAFIKRIIAIYNGWHSVPTVRGIKSTETSFLGPADQIVIGWIIAKRSPSVLT